MSIVVWASAAVAMLNIALTLTLLYIYGQNHRSMKTYFTFGLLIFATLFVVLNLAVVGLWFFLYTNIAVAQLFVDQAMTYLLIINVVESVGLLSLLRVTLE